MNRLKCYLIVFLKYQYAVCVNSHHFFLLLFFLLVLFCCCAVRIALLLIVFIVLADSTFVRIQRGRWREEEVVRI